MEGGRNKFGWLTKQLGKKKFQREIYHLFMFVENGFRNSHYYEIYNNGDEPGYSGECFVLREHFIRTEHITIVDKVNPFQ